MIDPATDWLRLDLVGSIHQILGSLRRTTEDNASLLYTPEARMGFCLGHYLPTRPSHEPQITIDSEMDAGNVGKWVEELLLPNLDQPCAIVIDNASYHYVKTDRSPTSITRKADIQVFL